MSRALFRGEVSPSHQYTDHIVVDKPLPKQPYDVTRVDNEYPQQVATLKSHCRFLHMQHPEDIDDAIQEAYDIALRRGKNLQDISDNPSDNLFEIPTRLLTKIISNKLVDRIRSKTRHPQTSLDEDTGEQDAFGRGITPHKEIIAESNQQISVEDEVDSRFRSRAWQQQCAALAPRQQLALYLRYNEELSYEDVASRMNIKPKTVKGILQDAHRILRKTSLPEKFK